MIDLPKNNAVVRNLGKKYKLVPYLEKAISQFEDPWEYRYEEKEKDDYWHPSGHCLPDASDLYDMAVNPQHYEDQTGNGLQKAYQVGHFWHQWLQYIIVNKLQFADPESIERRAMHHWGDKEVARVGITEGGLSAVDWQPPAWHAVRGSADVCPLMCPSWEGLLDIKTMGSQMYKKAETGLLPFAEKYECQLQTYMALFDVPQCMLLAVNKDTPHSFQEFYFERDDELIETLFGKWEFVAACIDLGEPPVKEDDRAFALPELKGPIAA